MKFVKQGIEIEDLERRLKESITRLRDMYDQAIDFSNRLKAGTLEHGSSFVDLSEIGRGGETGFEEDEIFACPHPETPDECQGFHL